MELCLVRHAIAEKRGPQYPDDGLRPLTAEGRDKMALAAKGLRRLWTPELLYTSPLLRAAETAEIIEREYGGLTTVAQPSIAQGPRPMLELLQEAEAQRVMVVGHEPHLSELLALLLTGETYRMTARFKKGAAALVTANQLLPERATLEWLLQPAALREIGAS